jgi:hypothetical protein
MSAVSQLIESVIEMPGKFADVATQGPLEGILLLFGALFVVLPSAVLAYLALGAGADLVIPGRTGARHPEE